MVNKETMFGAGIGAWIGSVVSVFLTRGISPTDTFLNVLMQGGLLTLLVTMVVLVIIKFFKL
ncbi:MAG: hypothetical protein AABX29_00160 [Nanoarchaeota archaeon]